MRWRFNAAVFSAAAVALAARPLTATFAEQLSPISTTTWRNLPNHAYASGEECLFVIKWGVVTAGRASLSVKEVGVIDGRPAFHIVAAANSTGAVDTFYRVRDQNESWLDQTSLVSVRYGRHIQEGKYRIEETTLIDQPRHRFALHAYRVDKDRYEDFDGPVPDNVLDVLGSLYYLRTLPIEVGHTYTFDVLSGKKVWPLKIEVRKRETIRVPAGEFDCFLVQPFLRQPGVFVTKGKKLEVWLTADESHMPVRMQSEVFIGHVAADLVSYRRPPH